MPKRSVYSKIEAYNQLKNKTKRINLSVLTVSILTVLSTHTYAEDFIPSTRAHAKPSPYAVMPMYDLNHSGGEMPYVQEQASSTLGALDTVAHSFSKTTLVGTSYNSATSGTETFIDTKAKGDLFYGRAIIVDEHSDDYHGASGEEQRFGYDRQAGQFVVGMTPRSSTDVKFVYVRDVIEDNKAPTVLPSAYNNGSLVIGTGFGVDPTETDRQIVKLMWDEKLNGSHIKDLHVELYSINLDRAADNYSLRESTVIQNRFKVDVDREVAGMKIDSDILVSDARVNLALDYTNINHNAQRNGGPTTSGLDAVSAYHYPGVEMDEWLLSATSLFDIADRQTMTFGVSYKYVDADATKASLNTNTPMSGNLSALDLYQTYYGDVDIAQSEGHASGKLQWDYNNQSNLSSYASIANFSRSPDTQERYFAVTSFVPSNRSPMGPDSRAVGNPEIDWEQHRRLEAGASQSNRFWVDYGQSKGHGLAWQIDTSVYYDDVHDFISRDRATGQTSTGASDYARIWRNVDATMAGIQIDAKANLTNHLSSRIALNYVDGKNTTDNRALYGMAPFEANLFMDYFDYLSTGGTWNTGVQVRYVAKHDDVDADPTTGSGFDAGETDDFTVLNVYVSAQLWDRIGVKAGVNNLTDESYYDSTAQFPLEGNPYLVEAPERSFYVSLAANF